MEAEKIIADKSLHAHEFRDIYVGIVSAIKAIRKNFCSNSTRLEGSSFLEYDVVKQLQMLFVFYEDQCRLIQQQVENTNKGDSIHGYEMHVSTFKTRDGEQAASASDKQESLLEIIDTLARYLYFKCPLGQIKEPDDVCPYEDSKIEEIMLLAEGKFFLDLVWERIKFRNWNVEWIETQGRSYLGTYPPSHDELKYERASTIRYYYKDHADIHKLMLENGESIRKSFKFTRALARPHASLVGGEEFPLAGSRISEVTGKIRKI
ncbi:hypothetical protein [Ferroacidibacillus organovorans]|uniref:hypothetical protein n=1 Tax=Ferroacidibacillus organovorans TaxID=1765683 RepID=UPI00128F0E0A|nr:hypothetical protein [Ferroacidibacillus organovorans]